MASLSGSSPVSSDPIKNGPTEIRNFKDAFKEAFMEEHEDPSASSTPIRGRHKFPYGNTAARPTATSTSQRFYVNTQRAVIEFESSGAWSDAATVIGSGAILVFYGVLPTGFTIVTNFNDRLLRIVSSAGGGVGGTANFSTCFSSQNTGAEASHTHLVSGTTGTAGGAASGQSFATSGLQHAHDVSITSGAGSSHLHSIPNFDPYYTDVIMGQKS